MLQEELLLLSHQSVAFTMLLGCVVTWVQAKQRQAQQELEQRTAKKRSKRQKKKVRREAASRSV